MHGIEQLYRQASLIASSVRPASPERHVSGDILKEVRDLAPLVAGHLGISEERLAEDLAQQDHASAGAALVPQSQIDDLTAMLRPALDDLNRLRREPSFWP